MPIHSLGTVRKQLEGALSSATAVMVSASPALTAFPPGSHDRRSLWIIIEGDLGSGESYSANSLEEAMATITDLIEHPRT